MSFDNIRNTFIPNPLSSNTTLSQSYKQAELARGALSMGVIVRNGIFLILLGYILVEYARVPMEIVIILIGPQAVSVVVIGYLRILALKSIYRITSDTEGSRYLKVVTTSERYALMQATSALVAVIISVGLMMTIYPLQVRDLSTQYWPPQLGKVEYAALALLLFQCFEIIMQLVRYIKISGIMPSHDLAQMNQAVQIIDKQLRLMKSLPAMCALLLYLLLAGVALPVIVLFLAIMCLVVVLSVVEVRRIAGIDVSKKPIDSSIRRSSIIAYQHEQLVGFIFGILRTSVSFKDIFRPFGMSFLGAGTVRHPENTLLFTTYRILMVQVPMTGNNTIVGGTILFHKISISIVGN